MPDSRTTPTDPRGLKDYRVRYKTRKIADGYQVVEEHFKTVVEEGPLDYAEAQQRADDFNLLLVYQRIGRA